LLIKFKNSILKYKQIITAAFSFLIPFIVYILTLEPKLVGGDTSWYANQLPQMYLLPPTGYPTFSLLAKLMSLIPLGDLAYRLNLFSAIFGALTILFLSLAINKIVKNEIISLISSLILAFILPFWTVANRLEFDTLNSFFVALTFFSALLYNETKRRSHLYFFFFSLGLSLTDHPITFFIMPVLFIYIIVINPRIFKNLKAILLSVLFFIMPLVSYVYIPIRSLQGYGPATSLIKFFYYITGRKITGEIHGGSLGDKTLNQIIQVFKDYLIIIYNNLGIILIIITAIGFGYLIKKNIKFALFSFLMIIFNFTIITQYLDFPVENYLLSTFLIITFYIAFGFLAFCDLFSMIINKLQLKNIERNKIKIQQPEIQQLTSNLYGSVVHKKNKKVLLSNISPTTGNTINLKRFAIIKSTAIIILLLLFASLPFLLAYKNYESADYSKPEEVYLFWDRAVRSMEKNSVVFITSPSINIGIFIINFEQRDKNIKFIANGNHEYSIKNMNDYFEKGYPVYFIGNSNFLKLNFLCKQIISGYYWPRYNESLSLYKIIKPQVVLKIEYLIKSKTLKFGEKFSIEYKIKNNYIEDFKITSIELDLPDNIELRGVGNQGYIKDRPGISQDIYMWVSDYYIVTSGRDINLILELQAVKPGKSAIKFRITSHEAYIDCDDIEIEVTSKN
jgi:hypothetical protein